MWLFWLYSFLGFLLEKGFAAVTHSPHQVRKGFLLLPLCPVYGLGVLAVLALPPTLTDGFWPLALWGGLTATAVEYLVHLAYDRLLHVRFWDYSGLRGNLHGRVCPVFAAAWGLLLAALLPPLQAIALPLAASVPPAVTYGMTLVFTADVVASVRVLRLTGDPEALTLR
jgi:uncharacterized membrane protein